MKVRGAAIIADQAARGPNDREISHAKVESPQRCLVHKQLRSRRMFKRRLLACLPCVRVRAFSFSPVFWLQDEAGSKDELEAAVSARAAAVRQGHEERKRRVLAFRAAAMVAKRNHKRLLKVRRYLYSFPQRPRCCL